MSISPSSFLVRWQGLDDITASELGVIVSGGHRCLFPDRGIDALMLVASFVACDARNGSPADPTNPAVELAPLVTAISPTEGPISGGNAVASVGSGFREGMTVTFGGLSAADVRVISASVDY